MITVKFTQTTDDDFRKHREFLRRNGKSDGHKYQKYELDGINKSLKDNITKELENKKKHSNSIFPDKYEYGKSNYKMTINKRSHHVIFYTIEKQKDETEIVKVQKCIHSTELKKELEKRGIKPLKNCDKSLLNDLETVYKEDDVKLRDDLENEEETKEEVTDPETGKKIKKVKHTGPRGGHYYINDKGEHIYPEEWNESIMNMKSVKSYITESKIVSLVDYLKKMVG